MEKEIIGLDCFIYFELEDGTCGCKRVISSNVDNRESIEMHFNKWIASKLDQRAYFLGYEQFVPGRNVKMFEIFSSESDFKLLVPENIYKMTVKHIWTRPGFSSNVKDQSSESYYNFLKYVWVKFPTGKKVRLADVAQTFIDEDEP